MIRLDWFHLSVAHSRAALPPRRMSGLLLSAVLLLACLTGLLVTTKAHAQFAVIDIGAITQLITEVEILQDQLTTAQAHLAQAQTKKETKTEDHRKEQLLAGAPRNYLPTDWADLQAAMQGGGGFGGLGGGVTATLAINSILPDAYLALLPDDVRM